MSDDPGTSSPGAAPSGAAPAPLPSPSDDATAVGHWFLRTGMPRWVPRLIVLLIIAVALSLVAWHAIGQLGYFIRIVVYSLFASFALEPAVNWLDRHGWRRGPATLAVMLLAFVLGVVAVASMIPLILNEAQKLVGLIPGWVGKVNPTLDRWFGVTISGGSTTSTTAFLKQHLAAWSGNIAGRVLGLARSAVGIVFELLTIAMFTYYLVADAARIRRGVCSLFEPQLQRAILRGWELSIAKMGGYLYTKGLLAVIAALVTFVVLKIVGVPYAFALALFLAVFTEFVPAVGTYIGAIVPLVVAAVEKGLGALIAVLVFVAIYQQVENYLLSPRISAHIMELHPAVAFGAAIVGGSLFGVIGAFLALPAVAILQATVSTYVHRHELVTSELLVGPDDPAPASAP